MRRKYVGTSGWNYGHWKEIFYPAGMPSSKWLQHYVKSFNSVELNVTFYRLLRRETFAHWHQQTPPGFSFVAKGSRYITHIKRLKAVARPLDLFLRSVSALGEKLVCILWQLPPLFRKDLKRLEIFLRLLDRKTGVRQAFEFRHATWFDNEVYAIPLQVQRRTITGMGRIRQDSSGQGHSGLFQ